MSSGGKHHWYRDEQNPWVRSIAFRDVSAGELLARHAGRAPASGRESAWIFDIDSTLFCLGPRMRNIYLEFLRAHAQPPAAWLRALEFLRPETQEYDLEATFRGIFARLGAAPAEAAERAEALWEEFYPFWKDHFYSDRHLRFDVAYPGAVDFVHRVRAAGRRIVYLTGRNRPETGPGTLSALRAAGFEVGHDDVLVMKGRREEDDVEFKERAGATLAARFEVEALIDNEPENLVMFARRFKRSDIVLFHSVMSARLPAASFAEALGEREALRLVSFE